MTTSLIIKQYDQKNNQGIPDLNLNNVLMEHINKLQTEIVEECFITLNSEVYNIVDSNVRLKIQGLDTLYKELEEIGTFFDEGLRLAYGGYDREAFTSWKIKLDNNKPKIIELMRKDLKSTL